MNAQYLIDNLLQSAYSHNRSIGITAEGMAKLGFDPDMESRHQYIIGFQDGQTATRTEQDKQVKALREALKIAIDMLERGTFSADELKMLKWCAE